MIPAKSELCRLILDLADRGYSVTFHPVGYDLLVRLSVPPGDKAKARILIMRLSAEKSMDDELFLVLDKLRQDLNIPSGVDQCQSQETSAS